MTAGVHHLDESVDNLPLLDQIVHLQLRQLADVRFDDDLAPLWSSPAADHFNQGVADAEQDQGGENHHHHDPFLMLTKNLKRRIHANMAFRLALSSRAGQPRARRRSPPSAPGNNGLTER